MTELQKKIPIPKYIEKKNEILVGQAMGYTKEIVSRMSAADALRIGAELLKGQTTTLDKYILEIGTKTAGDGIRVYLPEILALTVGSGLLGAVIGYNWDTIKKELTK